MALKNKVKDLIEHIKSNKSFLDFNKEIFDIREGELFEKVANSIQEQISDPSTVKTMVERIPPINVLNKVNNKLSTLYTKEVFRETEDEKDLEMVSQYSSEGVNDDFNDANQNYNSYKNTVVEIYEDEVEKKVATRSLPSYLFLPYSDDPVDPTRMTILIKFVGKNEDNLSKFYAYSDEEFVSFLEDGTIISKDMMENEGKNIYGVIPFQYINQSKNLLIPRPDQDIKRMTILIPLLLAEINFGNQYLSQPLIYGLDIEAEDFSRNANTVMMMKSDNEEKAGSLNVLQPNLNISEQLKLVSEQLAFWLSTKDVRAGTFGIKDGESALSALALMIKEMDATTNRDRQAAKFKKAELHFWRKLAKIHNKLADAGRLQTRDMFSGEDLTVTVRYTGQESIETRADKVTRLSGEVNNGLNSIKRAVSELNPTLTPEQIDEIVEQIREDKASQITIPTFEE